MVIVSRTVSTEHELNEMESDGAPNSGVEQAADPAGGGDGNDALDPLAEAEQRAASLKDQLLRMAADFDNFRKRSRREIEDASQNGRESLLKELLPVFDNLERATAHADASGDIKAFASGLDMVVRQFQDTLKKLGVERVVSVGNPFDPNVHEAIQQIETADVQPGHVAAEIQGGYRNGDRLIRPALVVVAKAKASSTDAEN